MTVAKGPKTQRSLQSPGAEPEPAEKKKPRRARERPAEPTPMFWAVCGLVSFAIIGSGVAWVARARADLELSRAPSALPKAPKPPGMDLLVQSVAPNAKLQFRGESITLPFHGEVASSKSPEVLEVSAAGFQGRRFWVKLDRARSFTVALPQGSGSDDATYEETLVAMGAARAVEPEAPPPALAPAPPQVHRARDPGETPPEKASPEKAPPAHAPSAPVITAPPSPPSAVEN